jgi:hypothetical protein
MSAISTTANAVIDPIFEVVDPLQDAGVEVVQAMAKVAAPYVQAFVQALPPSMPTIHELMTVQLQVIERVTRNEWAYVRRIVTAAGPALGARADTVPHRVAKAA